ncbi:MAG: hypothetical protein CMC68_08445 [Flavobacteriaceae bacterium]|nr:hypothetical protein [Flavobacteriaceae bacterium]|tara:strand:- start:12052 stop:12786 length:735 start_codon:yes stop_codon:yes gene_type:complete
MMKKILVLLVIITVLSCDSDNSFSTVSDYDFISFENDNVTFELDQDGESSQMITVYNSKTYSNDRTYNLEVLLESTTISAESYAVPASVTIPANERSAQFGVTITDNGFGSGDRLVLGFADDNTALNPHPLQMDIVIVCPMNELILDITFDNYAEETSWELYTDITTAPTLIASGSGYDDLDDQSIQQRLCIDNGDFGFVIYDAYGDGMCCSFGQGSYSLTVNGEVIHQGGSFGASEVTTFSLP